MNKIKNIRINKFKMKKFIILTVMVITMLNTVVYASVGTEKMDSIVDDYITPWAQKIGFLLAVFGGIQVIYAFISENPDSKTRGIQLLGGGIMLSVGFPALVNLIK